MATLIGICHSSPNFKDPSTIRHVYKNDSGKGYVLCFANGNPCNMGTLSDLETVFNTHHRVQIFMRQGMLRGDPISYRFIELGKIEYLDKDQKRHECTIDIAGLNLGRSPR